MVLGLLHGLESLEGPITVVAMMFLTHMSTAFGNFCCLIGPMISCFQWKEVLCSFFSFYLIDPAVPFYSSGNIRYLDQLGMAAKYNSKVYCRQSLIGGNYGLLDRNTFVPNPDYYRLDSGCGIFR